MKQKILLLILNFIAISSYWGQPLPPSGGGFGANDTIGCGPLIVEFHSITPNGISWSWDFGNGNTSTQQHPIEMFTAQGTFTISLDVVYQNGSVGHFERVNYIEVIPRPVIDVSVSSLSSCLNTNNVQFSNNTLNASQYLWDFGNGDVSTDMVPNYTFNSAGNYNVTFFATNSYGCSKDTTISNLVIHPVVQNSLQIIGDSVACDSSHVFAFEAFPGGLSAYSWEFSDGSQLNGATAQHSFNSFGLFDLTLITTDGNGCKDTTYSAEIVETTNVSDDFTVSTNSACEMTDIVFSTVANGATSVSWDFGDGNSGSGFSPSHSYQSTGQYDVTMVTTRPNGCGQTIVKPNFIEILSPPNMIVNFSDSIACVNEPIAFEAISTNAQTTKWLFADGGSSLQPSITHQYTNSGQYATRLIYSAGGCSDTISKLITVSQSIASFQNNSFANCAPSDIQFNSTSSNAVSWEWEFSNGVTSTDENPTITFNSAGQYSAQLIVEDLNGCLDTIFSNNALVISSNTPSNFQSANFEGCAPLAISFYNYSVGVGYWNWNFGDGQVSSGYSPSHFYTSPGEYVVSLNTMDSLGCNVQIDTFALVTVNSIIIDSLALELNCDSLQVNFSVNCPDCITGNWFFGDGTSSSLSDILHEYDGDGPYTANYTGVSNLGCVGSRIFTLDLDSCFYEGISNTGAETPASGDLSNWITSPDSVNEVPSYEYCNPVTINLENPVPNAQDWIWHFGDGSIGYGLQPSHTYDSIGLYTLMLEYFDGVTYDTLYYSNYINVIGHINNILVNTSSYCNDMNLNISSSDSLLNEYYWSIDNTLTPINSYFIDTVFSNNNQLHSITLTTIDSNYCSYSSSVGIISSGIEPAFSFDSTLCIGDSLIVEHAFPSSYQLEWNFGSNGISSDPYYVYDTTGNYNVTLTATDVSGCEIVYDLGQIEVSSSNSGFDFTSLSSLCVGDTISSMATDILCDTYSWSFNNVSMISNGANATGIAQAAGLYDITLETTTNGCVSSTTQNAVYTVNQAQADFVFSQDNLCLPIVGQFTDLSVSPISWNWDFGDSTTAIIQHPNHTYSTNPFSQVTLSIIDINGCAASVTKNNIAIFKADVNLSASNGCAPASIAFSDNSQNAIQWQWNFGDGTTDTTQAPSHIYNMDGVYDISLIVTSADGCQDSLYNPAMVEIDRVVANFFSNVNGGCAPQPAYFTDNSYNAVAWHWNFGNGAVGSQQNPIQVYHTGGNYTVELIVESSTGCTDTIISSTPLSIMGPYADFSILDTISCIGDSIGFVNNSQNANSFTWLFGDGSSSSLFSPSHEYTTSGNYSISLITSDGNGCQKIATQSHQISIESLPDVSFAISDTIGCTPLSVSLSSNSSGASYNWMLNGAIVGSASTFNTTLTTGNHSISMLAESQNGCINSSTISNIEVHPIYAPIISPIGSVCETNDTVVINSSLSMGNWFIDGIPNPSNLFNISNLSPGEYIITQEIPTYCGSSDSITLHIDSLITATMPPSQVVCENDNSFLIGSPSNLGFWSGTGIVNPYTGLIDPSSANYGLNILSYTVINNSCLFVDSIELVVNKQPDANFSIFNEVLCEGSDLQLVYPQNKISATYAWSITSAFDTISSSSSHPELNLTHGLWNIFVEVTDHGCSNTYEMSNITIYDTIAPNTPEIIRSTVFENEAILTEWEEPKYGNEKVLDFQIWRSIDSVNFSLVNSVKNTQFSYMDYNTSVDQQNYYYLIVPSNVCNVIPEKVNMSSSILLQSEEVNGEFLKFNWSEYYQWENGVDYYLLQKQNKFGEWETITKIDGTGNSVIIEKP